MKTMPTQLLEYLVQECTKEVLDQLIEEKKIGVKNSIDNKNSRFHPKKVNEVELPPEEAPSSTAGNQPEIPSPEKTPTEPPEKPQIPNVTPAQGPAVINPRDKSKLEPVHFQNNDEASIERTLHGIATKVAGPHTKVSLGAKRLARQAASSPGTSVFFYIGKTDPESEEVFLMADKSIQIAKDESVQPSELQGVPAAIPATTPDEEIPTDDPRNPHYFQSMTGKVRPKPRYGIDEVTQSLIKKAINKILDRR